jgi:outer membrane protein
MNRWFGLFLLCVSTASPAADLLSLYRDALNNNADFAAANAEYAAAQELVPQARSKMLPEVDLNGNITNTHTRSRSSQDNTYHFTNTEVGVQMVQPLYRKELTVQYAQAELRVREAQARLDRARQELALNVSRAYMEVLLADDNLALIKEQKAAIVAQLEQAKKMFEGGFGTITDVNEARARLDSIDAQEIDARNAQEVNLHALHKLTGTLPGSLSMLGDGMQKAQSAPDVLDKWVETAMERNPLIHQMQARLEASAKELEKARAGDAPTLDLVAGVSHSKDPGYTALDTRNTSAEIGVKFNMPLYQGGLTKSRVTMAKALEERARQELEATRRQVMQETRQEYLNVVSAVVKINALEQALKSHEVALDSMHKGFRSGVRTNVEILNQQQLLFTAKRDLNKARYESLVSRLQLKKATGELDEAEIAQVNEWLVAPDNKGNTTLAESISRIKHKAQPPVPTGQEATVALVKVPVPASASNGSLAPANLSYSPRIETDTPPRGMPPVAEAPSGRPGAGGPAVGAAVQAAPRPVARTVPPAGRPLESGLTYIQLGAFSEPQRALRLADNINLRLGGAAAQKLTYTQRDGLTKVQMGPYQSATEAERVQASLGGLGITPRLVRGAPVGPVPEGGMAPSSSSHAPAAPVPPVASQPAEPTVPSRAALAPTRTPVAAVSPPSPGAGVYLQLAALSSQEKARALMADVTRALAELPGPSLLEAGALFKVRVGPFTSAAAATEAAGLIERKLGIHPFRTQ